MWQHQELECEGGVRGELGGAGRNSVWYMSQVNFSGELGLLCAIPEAWMGPMAKLQNGLRSERDLNHLVWYTLDWFII